MNYAEHIQVAKAKKNVINLVILAGLMVALVFAVGSAIDAQLPGLTPDVDVEFSQNEPLNMNAYWEALNNGSLRE